MFRKGVIPVSTYRHQNAIAKIGLLRHILIFQDETVLKTLVLLYGVSIRVCRPLRRRRHDLSRLARAPRRAAAAVCARSFTLRVGSLAAGNPMPLEAPSEATHTADRLRRHASPNASAAATKVRMASSRARSSAGRL